MGAKCLIGILVFWYFGILVFCILVFCILVFGILIFWYFGIRSGLSSSIFKFSWIPY